MYKRRKSPSKSKTQKLKLTKKAKEQNRKKKLKNRILLQYQTRQEEFDSSWHAEEIQMIYLNTNTRAVSTSLKDVGIIGDDRLYAKIHLDWLVLSNVSRDETARCFVAAKIEDQSLVFGKTSSHSFEKSEGWQADVLDCFTRKGEAYFVQIRSPLRLQLFSLRRSSLSIVKLKDVRLRMNPQWKRCFPKNSKLLYCLSNEGRLVLACRHESTKLSSQVRAAQKIIQVQL